MQPTPLGPDSRRPSSALAVGKALLSLAVFVVVFIAFMLAPLVTLPVAGIVYLVLRTRTPRRVATPQTVQRPASPTEHGFGSGM